MSLPQADNKNAYPDTRFLDQTDYDPAWFGYPHDEAEPQLTEPFWHQYPYWSRPGNQLYYYPELQSFFDHPLYITYAMDGQPTIIGYGKNSQFSKMPISDKTAPKRRYVEMVEIYIANEFVQQVPMKQLLRFSAVAKREFGSRTGNHHRHDSMSVQERASESLKLNWADEVNAASEEGSSSPAAKTLVASGSQERAKSAQSSTRKSASPGENHKRRLGLTLSGIEINNMPSVDTVKAAITWMQDNADVKDYDKILDYAPPVLDDMSFETLLDFYQAALAFSLQPFGKVQRLRNTILNRITNLEKMDLEMLETVTQYIPARDSITARAITRAHECWGDHQYNAKEWLAIKDFLLRNSNNALAWKAHAIIKSRQQVYAEEERQRDQADEADRRQHAEVLRQQDRRNVDSGSDHAVVGTGCSETDGGTTTESHDTEAMSIGRRRRNRRGQQRRGLGSDGRAVPGASYE